MIGMTLLMFAALVTLMLGGFYGWGLSLPAKTRAARDVCFVAGPEVVHERISNIAGQRVWRSDIG